MRNFARQRDQRFFFFFLRDRKFRLLPPTPLEFPIPSVVGVWIFSGNTHFQVCTRGDIEYYPSLYPSE